MEAQKTANWIAVLTGEITNAEFQARQTALGLSGYGTELNNAAGSAQEAGKAIADTTQKVEELGKTITVRSMGANGPVEQTFRLADGIGKSVESAKKQLDDLNKSADESGKKIKKTAEEVYGVVRSVPDALRGERPAEALTEGLDQAQGEYRQTGEAATAAGTVSTQAAEQTKTAWVDALDNAQRSFQELPTAARTAAGEIVAEVARIDQALTTVGTGAAQAATNTEGGAAGSASGLSALFTQMPVDAATAVDGIVAEFDRLGTDLGAAMAAITEQSGTAFAGIQPEAQAAAEGVVAAFRDVGAAITTAFAGITAAVQSQFDALEASVTALVARLEAQLRRLQSAINSANSAAGTSNGGGGFNSGGMVRGPGSGTSDSILAWLSNGEFVIRASTVQKWGQPFFEMLNRGVFDPARLLGYNKGGLIGPGALPRFNLGGLVDEIGAGLAGAAPLPIYAGARDVDVGRSTATVRGTPVTINLDGKTYPLMADDQVAAALSRHARNRGNTRAGRPANWSP